MISFSRKSTPTGESWRFDLEPGQDSTWAVFVMDHRDRYGQPRGAPLPWLHGQMSASPGEEEALWDQILATFRQEGILEWLYPGSPPSFLLGTWSRHGFFTEEACRPLMWREERPALATRLLQVDAPPESRPGPFGASYRASLAATHLSGEEEIQQQDGALVDLLTKGMATSGLGETLGVTRILSMGSTSRGTHAWLPVDFDLMVETRVARRDMDLEALRPLLEGFAPAFSGLLKQELFLGEWGPRGEETVVARYRTVEGVVVDITLGRTRRPADYAAWMTDYLTRLPGPLRHRQVAEIRLAKRFFQAVGGVYGSSDIGLRPITIEQWVIQGWIRRASGLAVGTLDGLLGHLIEEGFPDFATYRRHWPLWRPLGEWEIGPGMDLFQLLANGEPMAAQKKWDRILEAARGYGEKKDKNLGLEGF